MSKDKASRGPDPDRLVLDGDWRDAVKKAVGVRRPDGGWPKPEPKKPGNRARRSGKNQRKS